MPTIVPVAVVPAGDLACVVLVSRPVFLLDGEIEARAVGGALSDVAPTLLGVMGIPPPREMTGYDLRVFDQR